MSRCRPGERGFALPLVILIALVASLTIGLILMRHGSSHVAVERQIEVYRNHHRHMGVQELIDRWLATTRGSVRERLGDGGLAFELAVPGSTIRVYLEDAQGAALEDLQSLHGPETRYARRMLSILDASAITSTDEGRSLVFRKEGPGRVSIHTARPEVLDALAQSVAPTGAWERFSREIQQRRSQRELIAGDVRGAGTDAGLSGEEVTGLEMMLTAEPTLWKVTVLLSGTGRREGAQGLIEVASEPSSMGRATRFLTWRDLKPDDDGHVR
ncbi:MAG: hypothetical protein AB7G11_10655 [Phycisphaerales bacterium]